MRCRTPVQPMKTTKRTLGEESLAGRGNATWRVDLLLPQQWLEERPNLLALSEAEFCAALVRILRGARAVEHMDHCTTLRALRLVVRCRT